MGVGASSVDDEYHLQKVKLGEGSFGVVWRAVHRNTGEVVAIKQMSKVVMAEQGIWNGDVKREIRFMNLLQHENIVKLYRNFEDPGNIYLALEFCDDGDFGDKVVERRNRMTEAEVAFWVRQILAPIAYLHSLQICHRDVKPDNFLVQSCSSTLKLADLGLAVECLHPGSLRNACGTMGYMAPELRCNYGYGLEVDVWAAGLCMYMAMMGGRHPFLDIYGNVFERRAMAGQLDFYMVRSWSDLADRNPRVNESEEAQALCRAMVEVDVRRRISAARACEAPWFNQGESWAQKIRQRSRSDSKQSATSQFAEMPRLLGHGGGCRVAYRMKL